MSQVTVNVNGRSYRFDCGDGEEARLHELATYVKERIDMLTREYGHVGAERLMLMAALLITDELWDARAAVNEMTGGQGGGVTDCDQPDAGQHASGGEADVQSDKADKEASEADADPEVVPQKLVVSGDV